MSFPFALRLVDYLTTHSIQQFYKVVKSNYTIDIYSFLCYHPDMDTEKYYTLKKVSDILPVSRQRVYKMHEVGKFPHAIVAGNGTIRVPATDVRAYALARAKELKAEAIRWEVAVI